MSNADTLGYFQSCNTLWRLVFPCRNLPSTCFTWTDPNPHRVMEAHSSNQQGLGPPPPPPPKKKKKGRRHSKDNTPTSSLRIGASTSQQQGHQPVTSTRPRLLRLLHWHPQCLPSPHHLLPARPHRRRQWPLPHRRWIDLSRPAFRQCWSLMV